MLRWQFLYCFFQFQFGLLPFRKVGTAFMDHSVYSLRHYTEFFNSFIKISIVYWIGYFQLKCKRIYNLTIFYWSTSKIIRRIEAYCSFFLTVSYKYCGQFSPWTYIGRSFSQASSLSAGKKILLKMKWVVAAKCWE